MRKHTLRIPGAAVVVLAILAFGGAQSSGQLVLDTFQNDTVASPPANWSITGTNGTTVTGNVATQSGNQYVALRDTSTTQNLSAQRNWGGATQGFVKFDIRFNQGINDFLILRLLTPAGHEPVNLQWFHNAHNTATPLLFRARGNGAGFGTVDPNAFALISTNFPVNTGNWETVTIFFQSDPSPNQIWGRYQVNWNGFTKNYLYVNQNGTPPQLVLDRLHISHGGSSLSVDIDNVLFVPEPTASGALLLVGVLSVAARRRVRR